MSLMNPMKILRVSGLLLVLTWGALSSCIGDPSQVICEGCEPDPDTPVDPWCRVGDEAETIREAYDAGCDVIEVASQTHARLDSEPAGPLEVSRSLVIRGGGSGARIAVEGGLLVIGAGHHVRLLSLTVEQSEGSGELEESPFLVSGGTLVLEVTQVRQMNTAGHAVIRVEQSGTLLLEESRILNNTASGSGPVALRCDQGTISAKESEITGNRVAVVAPAPLEVRGGAIGVTDCSLHLEGSVVGDNDLDVVASQFLQSASYLEVRGAGLFARASQVELDRTTFSGNRLLLQVSGQPAVALGLDATGAAIALEGSDFVMRESTLDNNQVAVTLPWGIEGREIPMVAAGGGLYSHDASEKIIRVETSTISRNRVTSSGPIDLPETFAVGGGIAFSYGRDDPAQLQVVNSTISGNVVGANQTLYDPIAKGAGIYLYGADEATADVAVMRYSTIAFNSVQGASRNGGIGLHVEAGQPGEHGMVVEGPPISMIGLHFRENTGPLSLADCGGQAWVTPMRGTGLGRSGVTGRTPLVDDECQHWMAPADGEASFFMVQLAVPLGDLSDNGGPTMTHLPSVTDMNGWLGSVAAELNRLQPECEDVVGTLSRDQRGRERPSYELGPPEERIACVTGAVDPSPWN
jgi:hypothetical protein